MPDSSKADAGQSNTKSSTNKPDAGTTSRSRQDERNERLARALRENLLKRKRQQRDRAAAPGET